MEPIKKIIAGIGVATTFVLGAFVYPVDPDPITIQEWQALTALYDYEIKQMGGASFANITQDEILVELHEKIRARTPTEQVKINGYDITVEDYELLREDLMDKIEKTSLLKKLTK